MLKQGLLIVFLMVISFALFKGAHAMVSDAHSIPAIDVVELEKRLGTKTPPFLLDVREPAEYQAGHIKGAVLIPLGSLPERLNDIPKDKPVVVICRSGNRSGRATAFLLGQGYKNVENLAGGMNDWAAKCETNKAYC